MSDPASPRPPSRPDRLLPLKPDVVNRVPVHRLTIRRKVLAGTFPAPVRVGGRVFWRESEIDAFIAGTWTPAPSR